MGEYYEFKNGLNKGKEYFGSGVPIVNFTDVFNKRGIVASDLLGKVEADQGEIKSLQVRQGDIFFTRTSETLEEVGMPSVMLDQPEQTVFSGFVLRGRAIGDDPLTLLFKRYAFYAKSFRNEMIRKSSMTTRALTSGAALKSMVFSFPSDKAEQDAIGALFQHLDSLITLHQRKQIIQDLCVNPSLARFAVVKRGRKETSLQGRCLGFRAPVLHEGMSFALWSYWHGQAFARHLRLIRRQTAV